MLRVLFFKTFDCFQLFGRILMLLCSADRLNMDVFSLIGVGFILYYAVYTAIIVTGDCDVRLRMATIFGKRKLEKFKGKVIWITGASSGIGEYIARVLARYGAKLVLTARNESELERVKQACIEEGKLLSDDILVLPMDVTDLNKHQPAFDKVLHQFNQLDILVNNAGRSQRAIWELIDIQVDRDMFDLNFFSIVSLSKIAVKHFLERNEGHIVITSSVAGIIPVSFSPTYCGSKFALHGYFGSLLREKVGQNINLTLLCPGPVFSNILASSFTSKPGETFGQTHNANDSRMSTERCAYLSTIAIANNINEAWIIKSPMLLLTYMSIYFPSFSLWLYKRVGTNIVQRLRDNRITVQQN